MKEEKILFIFKNFIKTLQSGLPSHSWMTWSAFDFLFNLYNKWRQVSFSLSLKKLHWSKAIVIFFLIFEAIFVEHLLNEGQFIRGQDLLHSCVFPGFSNTKHYLFTLVSLSQIWDMKPLLCCWFIFRKIGFNKKRK